MRLVSTGEFEGGAAFVEGDFVPLSEAKISMFDWGFTRSDGTYDVVSVWHGAFFRLDDHLDRFFANLDRLRFRIPYSREQVREILHGCVRAGNLRESYVAMLCTRGVPARGVRDPRLAENRFYAYALPYAWIASREKQLEGIDLHISQRQRISPASIDPTIKNYHWLDLVQSLFEAYDQGRDTSCVLDADGNIAEGPGFNVFVVNDGVVQTTDQGVLEGISRRTAIELCERLGLSVRIAPFSTDALRNADEVFLTSTAGGIMSIAKFDGIARRQFPGPITTRLQDGYWAMHAEPAYHDPVRY